MEDWVELVLGWTGSTNTSPLVIHYEQAVADLPATVTRNIVEGTRGLFYTIGRSSLPAADTLRRRRRRSKQ